MLVRDIYGGDCEFREDLLTIMNRSALLCGVVQCGVVWYIVVQCSAV
jgi:hypothetical protein